jgi:hypothetical protein
MEKLTLLGLGIAGAGVASAKYFESQARKTSGQQQMNYRKISHYSSLAIPIGLGVAAYNSLLKGHPNRIAISLIPVGLATAFVTNFSLSDSGPNTKQKILGEIGLSVGLSSSIGGITYLLTKNTKTSLMVAGVSATLLYLHYMNKRNTIPPSPQSPR